MMNDVELIRKMAAYEPLPPPAAASLLTALGIDSHEERYSDFIAWLIHPNGLLQTGWLLDAIIERWTELDVAGTTPRHVVREYELESLDRRADILVEWDEARLIIENKVFSTEHNDQCAAYLARCDALIYLSPTGREPTSVKSTVERRLTCMSYGELARVIREGLASGFEHNGTRGHVLAEELARSLEAVAPKGEKMQDQQKPTLSDSTVELFKHHERLDKLVEQAKGESEEAVNWVCSESRARMSSHSSTDVELLRVGYEYLFRLQP